MKKISIYTLSLAFVAVGMASCGKTTKGKMTNEWKVSSMEDVQTYVNANGDKQVSTISINGNAITNTEMQQLSGSSETSSSSSGTVNTNDFTIKKDGTWSWIMDVIYTDGSSASTERVEQSGTWSFLDKTKGDDFKKNERVLFNILALKATETEMENQVVVDSNTDNLTYTTGKYTMIYTVKESKKDKLELELESMNTMTQDTYSGFNSTSRKITLDAE